MGSSADAVTAWESLFRAQVSVMRSLSADFPDEELSFNEYDVMFTISRAPEREIRLRDLTKNVLLSQPSVSRLLDRLVARGFVAKCPEPTDGRGSLIRMTAEGYDAFHRVAVQHAASITRRVGSQLDDSELAELRRICDKLRASPQNEPECDEEADAAVA